MLNIVLFLSIPNAAEKQNDTGARQARPALFPHPSAGHPETAVNDGFMV
jgi:hypothetical protein